jgi:integrase
MTGHIRRRGKSSWELKFDAGSDPVTGKRRIRYQSFKGTKRDAEIELARLVSENAAGAGIDPSKETIAEFMKRWDRDWTSSHVSPKTLERYRQIVRLQIVPHIGALRMQKLRPVHLNELYAMLLREGGHKRNPLSPASVGYVHRILHRALGHAATWGLISQNPASLVGPPPTADTEIKILDQNQVGPLLDHLNGRSLRPIVAFLLHTGARRGEALALRWQDIDLDRGVVRIERSLEQTKGGLRFKSPKTKSGRRNIAISPWLIAELRAHRTRQQEQRLRLGLGRAATDSLVFARWDGATRSPHWLTQKFAKVAAALTIDCSLHGLRHTHVSALIASGLDVLTISRRIGHASPAITLAVYGHLFSNTDAKAADIMQAAFGKVRTE